MVDCSILDMDFLFLRRLHADKKLQNALRQVRYAAYHSTARSPSPFVVLLSTLHSFQPQSFGEPAQVSFWKRFESHLRIVPPSCQENNLHGRSPSLWHVHDASRYVLLVVLLPFHPVYLCNISTGTSGGRSLFLFAS